MNLFEDRHDIELLGVELKKTQLKRDLYVTIRKRKQERLNAFLDEDNKNVKDKENDKTSTENEEKEQEDRNETKKKKKGLKPL